MTLRYFPVAFGVFEHHEGLDVEPEISGIARMLDEFGAQTVDWDVPMDRRGLSAAVTRLDELQDVTEPGDTFLYWLGHGTSDGQSAALACADSPADFGALGIRAEAMAATVARLQSHRLTADNWAIVVIDACKSAQFVRVLSSELDRNSALPRRLLVVGVSGEGATRLGEFRRTLEHIVGNTFRASDIPLLDLMAELERNLPEDAEIRGLRVGHAALHRRSLVPSGVTIDVFAQVKAALSRLSPDEQQHFIPKAQGAELGEIAWYFEGREQQRREISRWLRESPGGLLVVTGPAGSGKSALLGHLVEQSRPALRGVLISAGLIEPVPEPDRPPDEVFDAVVHLTGMSAAGLLAELARGLRLTAPERERPLPAQADELLYQLARSGGCLTILLDALDEAQEPLTTAREVVRRLAELRGVRVVVGTRSSTRESPDQPGPLDEDLLEALGDGFRVVVDADPAAVTRYVAKRLRARLGDNPDTLKLIADASEGIGGSFRHFLFAQLAVHEILAEPGLIGDATTLATLLDCDHRELFAMAVRRLTSHEQANGALLEALGLAKGRGLPIRDGVWIGMARALQPSLRITEQHINELINRAAPYLMVDVEHDQTVYRLAHATFAQHYQAEEPIHLALFDGLMDVAEANPSEYLNPYLTSYLAEHAAEAGRPAWQKLAERSWTLDRIDPLSVAVHAIRTLFGRDLVPAEIAGVIGAQHKLSGLPPTERLGYRQLAMARCAGVSRPTGYPSGAPRQPSWTVRWAQLNQTPIHLVLSDKISKPGALVAFTDPSGRNLLGIGGHTIQICDPLLGHPVGQIPDGLPPVRALVPFSGPDGRVLLASGHADGTLRISDQADVIRGYGPRHTVSFFSEKGGIRAGAAFTAPGGRVLLVVAGRDAIGVYDPVTDDVLCRAWVGQVRAVRGLTVLPRPEGDVVLCCGEDGSVRAWDLLPESTVSRTVVAAGSPVSALVAFTGDDGRPLLAYALANPNLTTGMGVEICDPFTGVRVGRRSIPETGFIWQLAAANQPDGQTLLIAAGGNHAVRAWVPGNSKKGAQLAGHDQSVRAVTTVPGTDGRPLIASAGLDGTVRLWDSEHRRSFGPAAIGDFRHSEGGCGARARRQGADRIPRLARGHPDLGHRFPPRADHDRGGKGHAQTRWRPSRTSTGGSCSPPRWKIRPSRYGISFPAPPRNKHLRRTSARSAAGSSRPEARTEGYGSGTRLSALRWVPSCSTAPGKSRPSRTSLTLTAVACSPPLRPTEPSGFGIPQAQEPVGRPIVMSSGHALALAAFTDLDGHFLVAGGGSDGVVRVWNALSGAPVGIPLLGHSAGVGSLAAFPGPDGAPMLVSAGSDGSVGTWSRLAGDATGRRIVGGTGRVLALAAFTDLDGHFLVAGGGSDGAVRVWNALTGAPAGQAMAEHSAAILALTVFPGADGAPLLASAGADGTIRIWDPARARRTERPYRDRSGGVLSLARFAGADGRVLLAGVGKDRTVRVWDTTSGLLVGEFPTGHVSAVRALAAFQPTIMAFEEQAPEPNESGQLLSAPLVVAPSPIAHQQGGAEILVPVKSQGRTFLAMAGDSLRIWDTTHSGGVREINLKADAIAAVPDRTGHELLAVADGERVLLCDLETLDRLSPQHRHTPRISHTPRINRLRGYLSAAGRPGLITANQAGQMQQWDIESGLRATFPGHKSQVRAMLTLAMPYGEPVLVTGGGDGILRLRSLENQQILLSFALQTAIRDLAELDGGLLVATDSGLVQVGLPFDLHQAPRDSVELDPGPLS